MLHRGLLAMLLALVGFSEVVPAQPSAPFARYLGSPGNYPPDYRLQRGAFGFWLVHNFVDSTLFVPQLSKLRRDGSLDWSRDLMLSGIVSPRVRLLLADSSGLLLAGTLQQSGYKTFFTRVDTAGGVLSNVTVDLGAYNEPNFLERRGGSVVCAGYRDYPDGTGHYSFDMTLLRLDAGSQVQRASATGSDTLDYTLTTAVALRNGGLISAGEMGTRAQARFACQLAWWSPRDSLVRFLRVEDGTYFTRLRPVAAALVGDSAVVLAAVGSTTAGNEHEVVLMKLDTAGQLRWSKRYYQIAYDLEVRTLAVDQDGRICLTGNCYRSISDNGTFLLRTDPDGLISDASLFRAPVFTFGGNAATDLLTGSDGSWTYPVYYYAGNLYTPAVVHTDTSLLSPCTDLNDAFFFATAAANLQLLPEAFPFQDFLPGASDTLFCMLNNRAPNEGDLCLAVGTDPVDAELAEAWSVFPNPAHERVFVNGIQGNALIRLLDLAGKELLVREIVEPGKSHELSLEGLPAGSYLLVVQQEVGLRARLLLVGD